ECHLYLASRAGEHRALRKAQRCKLFRVRVVTQSNPHSTQTGVHIVQRVFEGGLTGDAVAVRIAALLLAAWAQPEGQAAAKFHADHQLTVHGAIEAELTAFS